MRCDGSISGAHGADDVSEGPVPIEENTGIFTDATVRARRDARDMTTSLQDKTGEAVTITLDERRPIAAYTVHLADGTLAGRVDFVDAPGSDGERIFFHTEVGQDFGGRGLAGLLVREALADSIRKGLTVVPVCPLFAAHLDTHGGEYLADGGRLRRPTADDITLVKSAVSNAR